MDKLRAMEVFVRVVETGSFTAAARALGLPKASASTLVRDLEARLAVKLLHRTTRRVATTREGALYYEEASRLLAEIAELEQEMGNASARPKGKIRVDVPAAAGRHVLAPALPDFFRRHPDITVHIGSTDRPLDLLEEGIDCVIRGGDVHDETLIARPLGALPVVTCASPRYLSAFGAPIHPDDLASHRAVAFFSPKTGRIFALDFQRGEDSRVWKPEHQVAANDTDTWLALALSGLGILQAPCTASVRRHIEDGSLVPVMHDWVPEELQIYALYPSTRKLPARVRVFIDWLSEIYARECAEARQFTSALRARRPPAAAAPARAP